MFTDSEHKAMAVMLCEKLAHTDVIGVEFTDLHNRIDHYVDANDGYLILREMLEDEHPGLEKDPIHCPPLLTECDGNLTLISFYSTSLQYASNIMITQRKNKHCIT